MTDPKTPNKITAALFFSLALVFTVDLGVSLPAIEHGTIVATHSVQSSIGKAQTSYCRVIVDNDQGVHEELETAVATCQEMKADAKIATERSLVFGRTTQLRFDGKTRMNVLSGGSSWVFFGCVSCVLLGVGSLTLPFSDRRGRR